MYHVSSSRVAESVFVSPGKQVVSQPVSRGPQGNRARYWGLSGRQPGFKSVGRMNDGQEEIKELTYKCQDKQIWYL